MSKYGLETQPICIKCNRPLKTNKHLNGQYWSDSRKAQHDLVCLECRPPGQWTSHQIQAFSQNPPEEINVDHNMIPCSARIGSRPATYNKDYDVYIVQMKK